MTASDALQHPSIERRPLASIEQIGTNPKRGLTLFGLASRPQMIFIEVFRSSSWLRNLQLSYRWSITKEFQNRCDGAYIRNQFLHIDVELRDLLTSYLQTKRHLNRAIYRRSTSLYCDLTARLAM